MITAHKTPLQLAILSNLTVSTKLVAIHTEIGSYAAAVTICLKRILPANAFNNITFQ